MKIFDVIDLVLDRVEKFALVLLLGGLVIMVCIQIILRLVGIPLAWTEELARYILIWCIYMGVSAAAHKRKHLKVDLVATFVKERGKYVLDMIGSVVSVFFFITLAYIMLKVFEQFSAFSQSSPAMHINMIYMYMSILFCALLSTIRYIEDIARMTVSFRKSRHKKVCDLEQ